MQQDRNNPIAVAFDETAHALNTEGEKRTIQGFMTFIEHSVEFQRLQRVRFSQMAEGSGMRASDSLYTTIALAAWMGFEAGKLYCINGEVERMLSLEDDCYRARVMGSAALGESEAA